MKSFINDILIMVELALVGVAIAFIGSYDKNLGGAAIFLAGAYYTKKLRNA